MIKNSNQSLINVSAMVRLLLIAALVWLPMADLMAGVVSDAGAVMAQSDHHAAGHSEILSSSVQAQAVYNDCSGHQTSCCSACVSFCSVSTVVSDSITFPRIERCRQFSPPLAVVILVPDLRPPIV